MEVISLVLYITDTDREDRIHHTEQSLSNTIMSCLQHRDLPTECYLPLVYNCRESCAGPILVQSMVHQQPVVISIKLCNTNRTRAPVTATRPGYPLASVASRTILMFTVSRLGYLADMRSRNYSPVYFSPSPAL